MSCLHIALEVQALDSLSGAAIRRGLSSEQVNSCPPIAVNAVRERLQSIKPHNQERAMNNAHEQRRGAMWKAWRRRQRHKANGLCLECTHKAVCGRQFCTRHLAKARAKAKHEYDWRIANGVCVSCGIPKEHPAKGTKCTACAGKAAAKERNRRMVRRDSMYLMPTLEEHKPADALSSRSQQNGLDEPAQQLGKHSASDLVNMMAQKGKRPCIATEQTFPEASPPLSLTA